MPALIALFAILGMPFQESWLTVPRHTRVRPHLVCHEAFVWDASTPEDLAQAEASDDKQTIKICWAE